MKNKKGFTLIELLAVIVILAVIALILTPIVSGIIKTAKKNAFESTGYGILESTKLYYSKQVGDLNSDLTFTCNNDICTSGEEKLEFKGNINGNGTVLLFKDGNIALCLESSDYATLKNISDERLSTTENGSCEFDEETKEYSVNASVSAKAYEELQNQYTVLNNTYTNGKEAILNSLNNKGITLNENATLEDIANEIDNITIGDPYLRYNEETGYVEVLNTEGNWQNLKLLNGLPYNSKLYLYRDGVQYVELGNPGGYYYDPYPNTGVATFTNKCILLDFAKISGSEQMIVGTTETVDLSSYSKINLVYAVNGGDKKTVTYSIDHIDLAYISVQINYYNSTPWSFSFWVGPSKSEANLANYYYHILTSSQLSASTQILIYEISLS